MNKFLTSICLMFLLLFTGRLGYAETTHLYSTWSVLEFDACASAWLFKRFIDPQAHFKFYAKGELITDGVAFNTPDAKFNRTQKKSTYENILNEYKFNDPALIRIGQMINTIEIDYWASRPDPAAKELNLKIKAVIKQYKNPDRVLEQTDVVLDELYASLKGK